jgi:hypothetical protein
MAVTLDRLKSQLLTSGLQQENFALFQVINQLIDFLRNEVAATEAAISGSSGGGGGAGLLGATYLTKNKEVLLPNSLQVLPGAGIQFNDAGGRRIISAAMPFGLDGGGEAEDGPPGPPGIDGKMGVDGTPGRDGIQFIPLDGEDGVDGEPGLPGATGGAGPTGAAGAPGIPGIDGLEGEIGEIGFPGPVGPRGLTGGNSGVIFWFNNTDASDLAGYFIAQLAPSANAESTIVQVCAGTGDNLIVSFATPLGVPGVYAYQAGKDDHHVHAAVTTVGGFARFLMEIYYCNADGTGETLIGSSYSDSFTDTSIDEVNFDFYNTADVVLLDTQRLVYKLYVARVSGPANVSVTTYFEGATHQGYTNAPIAGQLPQPGPQGQQGFTGPIGPPGIDAEEPETPIWLPGPTGPAGPAVLNVMRTTANQTINAGAATYVDVTNLTFPVVNGVTYAFYFYVVFQSAATTTGWKAAINCPTGTLDYFATGQTIANGAAGVATWLQRHTDTRDDMTLLTSTITANVDLLYMVQGRYICTANGTLAVRFANELNANTDITVRAGSWGWWF